MSKPTNWNWIVETIDANPVWQYRKDPNKKVRIVERFGDKNRAVRVDHGAYTHSYNADVFVRLYEPEVSND